MLFEILLLPLFLFVLLLLLTGMAIAMTFVIAAAEIDLSVGSIAGLSSVVTAITVTNFGLVPGILAGLASGAVIGAVNGGLVALLNIPSFLVTLGMLGLAAGIAQWITGSAPQPITDDVYVMIFGGGDFGPVPGLLVWTAVIVALGHSFFTLSLGMGAIMAYGAYMPAGQPLGQTVLIVGFVDTLVALVAGLVIFPIVFTHGLEPGAGPGLMFQTLPVALGALPGGVVIGTVFFVLVLIAAWSSAISIAEPAVAWAVEKGFSRARATVFVCSLAWALGLGTVFSFNDWSQNQAFVTVTELNEAGDAVGSEFYLYAAVDDLKKAKEVTGGTYEIKGKTLFDIFDFLTTNILLPLGGVLIALFTGWFMSRSSVEDEARLASQHLFAVWRFMIRFVSPAAILLVLYNGLF